jgi:hypothetical protein
MQYVNQNTLILIPVLIILGKVFKKIPKLEDCYIPVLLMFIGSILSCVILKDFTTGVIQGVLVGGTATGLHQIVKQIDKEDID